MISQSFREVQPARRVLLPQLPPESTKQGLCQSLELRLLVLLKVNSATTFECTIWTRLIVQEMIPITFGPVGPTGPCDPGSPWEQ